MLRKAQILRKKLIELGYPSQLNQALWDYLSDEGYIGQLNEALYFYLEDRGYEGTLSEKLEQWEKDDFLLSYVVFLDNLINGYARVGDDIDIFISGNAPAPSSISVLLDDVEDATSLPYEAPDSVGSTVQIVVTIDGEVYETEVVEIGKAPIFDIDLDQGSVDAGDELGTDITSSVTLIEEGYPVVVEGDVEKTWLLAGGASLDGALVDYGDTVVAVGTLEHPLYDTGVNVEQSSSIAAPSAFAPTISLSYSFSQAFSGVEIDSADLIRTIDDPGLPVYAGTGTFTFFVDDVETALPFTPSGGETIYFVYEDNHLTGDIVLTSATKVVSVVADPTIVSGLTNGAAYGQTELAAIVGTTLVGDVTGTPDSVKWVYADDEDITTNITDVSGETTDTLATLSFGDAPDGKYIAFAAVNGGVPTYSQGYLVRKALPAAGSLSSVQYTSEIDNVDRDIASGFTANGNTFTYSLVSPPAGYSIASGSIRRVNTNTAVGATITIRATDEYGWYVQTTETIAFVTFALSVTAGLASLTYGADDPSDTTYSGTFTGGDYDGRDWSFTKAQATGLSNGDGVPLIAPEEPDLTTDAGTTGVLDSGDEAEEGLDGLWGYPSGNTPPTISKSLRDQSGELEADIAANPYTADGSEVGSIFIRESDGSVNSDSTTVPVADSSDIVFGDGIITINALQSDSGATFTVDSFDDASIAIGEP